MNRKNIKILTLILVFIIALTGCGGKSEKTSDDDKKQKKVTSPEAALEDYIEAYFYGDVDLIENLAPEDFWEYAEDEFNVKIKDVKKKFKNELYGQISYVLENEYGENIKVLHDVIEITEFSSSKFEEIKKTLTSKYDISEKDVKEAVEIEVELTIKGDDDEITDNITFCSVKIDGSWYMCSSEGKLLVAELIDFVNTDAESTAPATEEPINTPHAEVTAIPTLMPTKTPIKTPSPTIVRTPQPTEAPTAPPTQSPSFVDKDPMVDAKLYRFYDPDKYMWDSESFISSEDEGTGLTAVGPACIYFYDEDESALCIQLTNYDPYFPIKGGEDGENFNLSEYPVFKIRLKNETCFETFETFLIIGTGVTGDDNFRFNISSEDEEYKEYIVDIGETNGQDFLTKRDPISGIRLDALAIGPDSVADLANPSPYLFIEYFGFFKTVEDAQNWNPAHVA